MKRNLLPIAALIVLLAALSIGAEDSRTLNGKYNWSQGGSSGDLEAVFTPAGENAWNVEFYFYFRGRDNVYTGTAEGSLAEGRLNGTVKNENKNRTFTFEGKIQNGKFKGSHAEIIDGRPKLTGTISLKI